MNDIFVLDYGYIIDSEQSKQSRLISEESVKTMSGSNIAEKILAAHIGGYFEVGCGGEHCRYN